MFCFSFHQTLTRTVRSSKQIFVHRIPTKGGNCQFLGFFVGESPQREHGSFVISVFVGRILIVFEILSNVIIRVLVHHSFYYFCGLWNAGYIISLHKRKTWVFTLISKLTQISFTVQLSLWLTLITNQMQGFYIWIIDKSQDASLKSIKILVLFFW